MLIAKNITYQIGEKKLLDDVSVSFEPGKLHLIIGPNGAGKSTLVKVLSNQIQTQTGTVHYGKDDLKNLSLMDMARMRAVLSQHIEMAFPLTVAEVVMMGRYPHFSGKPTDKDEQACEEAMRFFDVLNMAGRNYLTLSGGEQQRVHFARVAAQVWYPAAKGCRYLILDEPLTFLDVYYQFQFMQQTAQLLGKGDLVVIGVVHDLNLAAKFADQVVLLNRGTVLACGTAQQVLTKEHIKTAYQLEPVIYDQGKNRHLFFE